MITQELKLMHLQRQDDDYIKYFKYILTYKTKLFETRMKSIRYKSLVQALPSQTYTVAKHQETRDT